MILYGRNPVREALRAGRRTIAGIWATERAIARESWLRDAFFAALADDFNTAAALGALFEWINERHQRRDEPVGRADLVEMLSVLGLQNLAEHGSEAGAEEQELLDQRVAARAAGDYAEADRLRDELRARGWEVRDGAAGPELVRVEQ